MINLKKIWKNDEMDNKLTKIWKDEDTRWRILFIIISSVLSAVFAYITKNIILTIAFIIVTACIDLLVELYKYIKFDFCVRRIFDMKKGSRYLFFVTLSILPAFFGFVELVCTTQMDDRSLLLNLCNNLVSNILGALIVCSIINHIKRFNYEQIIENFIVLRKDVYNSFLKITVFACFINAVNFNLNSKLPIMNKTNKIYLIFIIFYGMFVFYAFALRIIDKTSFSFSIKEIYPKGVLGWAGVFLFSCNISVFLGDEKGSYPILLLINTITAFTVAVGILFLLAKRAENSSDSYPLGYFLAFGIAIALNSWAGFKCCKDIGNVMDQIISGGVLFVAALFLLLYLARKQAKNDKKERQKYYFIVSGEEDFLGEKNVLEKISIFNKNIEIKRLNNVEELFKEEPDNNIELDVSR